MGVKPCIVTIFRWRKCCPRPKYCCGSMVSNYGRCWTMWSWRNITVTMIGVIAKSKIFVTTQVGEDPDAIGLYCISEEGIKGLPSKASLMASKTFLAFLRAVEI